LNFNETNILHLDKMFIQKVET